MEPGVAPWRPQIEHHQILGLIALAEGDRAGALRHLERSVEISDENVLTLGLALPNPSKPSWELYGEVLLEAGRPEEALAVPEGSTTRMIRPLR